MAHNRPTQPPTEEQKIDWFLDTVQERTYESVHASCVDKHIEGDLTFAKLVKMYTHKCFQRYPQFQISEIDPKAAGQLHNHANHIYKGKGKGKGKNHGPRKDRQPRDGDRQYRSPHFLPTGPTKAKANANHAAKERGRATPEETEKMLRIP